MFLMSCLVSCLGCRQDGVKHPSADISAEYDTIRSITLKQKELFEAPGMAVGILRNDSVIYSDGLGVKSLNTKEPMTTQSIFHMASVSKPFVAVAIVQLVEKGQVDLDEKLTHYLPYFTMADDRYKEITIRHMLSHTSGIPDTGDYEWDKPQYDDGAAERFARSQKSAVLEFVPGTQYSYSNTAFDILCDVVYKVSGMTFEAYTTANIFEPAGMNSSTFFKPDVNPELATDPHVMGKDFQIEVSDIYPYNRRHAGSSTLHSNVEDMLRWARLNLNRGSIDGNQVYSEASYELLTSVQTPEGEREIGLSWFMGDVNDSLLIYHSGGDTGYSTFFGFMPRQKAAIAMMANTDRFWATNNAVTLMRKAVFHEDVSPIAPIHIKLKNYILTEGIEKVKAVYFEEKRKTPVDYEFDGGYLDDLGYWLLDIDQPQKALDIFFFNTELEPEHAGWVDSVADAYRAMDSTDLAIKWYQKALEMKPDQDFSQRKLDELLEGRD